MPKRLAVLGQPISHSRSPAMQTAALAELGLADEWSYEAIEVAPEDFDERVRAMPGEGFVGANVTVPHKLAALAIADEASEAARAIGAANTLTFGDAADRRREHRRDRPPRRAARIARPAPRALVLGAGGSARAVVWALVDAGAEVSIWNRTPEKAERLARELGASSGANTVDAADFDLLVNATTVGMGGVHRRRLRTSRAFRSMPMPSAKDTNWWTSPTGRSTRSWCARARARRARVVDGLEVLVRQGAASLRIWTGLDPPIEAMRRAARSDTWQHENRPGYLRPVPAGDEATARQLEGEAQAGNGVTAPMQRGHSGMFVTDVDRRPRATRAASGSMR